MSRPRNGSGAPIVAELAPLLSAVEVEFDCRELPSEVFDQQQNRRFSPTSATALVNDLARMGWRIVPGTIFTVPTSEPNVGGMQMRGRVYAFFSRSLGSGGGASG